jgi:hypothetical protein
LQVLQGHVQPVPIVQQARSLHSDIATNIALRECIRIHKASIAEFKKGEDHVVGKTPVTTEMSRRIRMISRTLNYFEGAARATEKSVEPGTYDKPGIYFWLSLIKFFRHLIWRPCPKGKMWLELTRSP